MKLQAEKYITAMVNIDITIEGITILSASEYRMCQKNIEKYKGWWWLRSPAYSEVRANGVCDGRVYEYGYHVADSGISVRPALKIESDNLSAGEKFRFGGYDWTVISETLALCEKEFYKMPFRRNVNIADANNYEHSDIKHRLDGWLREQELLIGTAGKMQDDEESLKAVRSGRKPDMEERKPAKRNRTR